MGIGLSGMVSGLDTDSIVQAMVSAQKLKSTKIENKITLNKWTTDAWSSLNTKIYSFYTKFASKLRLQSSYMTRTAKSSDESAVTATASSSAAVGTHALQIKQLASSQYVTGGQLKTAEGAKADYSKTTKLTDMNMAEGTTINISGTKDVSFTVESDSTIGDFLDACKDAGLNANYDTSQQRFFISSMESGVENAFSITADGARVVEGMDAIISRVATEYLSEEDKGVYEAALKTLSNAAKNDPDSIDAAVAKVRSADFDAEAEGVSELELAIYDLKNVAVNSRAAKMADEIAADYTANNITAAMVEKAIHGEALTEEEQVIWDALDADTATALNSEIAAAQTTVGNIENNILGHMCNLTSSATDADLSAMGLGTVEAGVAVTAGSNAAGMTVVAAADAKFVLDGAEMTESSNNFSVNGITLNLIDTTYNKETGEYDSVQVTVGKDSDSAYELVKEALTEYNSLIEEMNKLYDADSARGYDPLTDEQKEAMTEEDIKNWEEKIKGSLLRRDNTLGTLLSGMRSALSSTYTDEETGKTYSLSTYGIVTGNYTEKGKLHIYGDTDDATYATYEDRLKKSLEEDPDQVMETLTHVFGQLYDTMTEKCAKTEISSALTFYNDKQYSTLLDDYEEDLDIMNDRITEMEDKYYKQFTAMEKALSKLQSQTNSLASLLGTTTQ